MTLHFNCPGAEQVVGAQRCMYVIGTEHYCNAPAVVHLWLMDDMHTMACPDHAAECLAHRHKDQHPVGGACGLPNTVWRYSVGDDRGWCEMDGFNLSELARIEIPERDEVADRG